MRDKVICDQLSFSDDGFDVLRLKIFGVLEESLSGLGGVFVACQHAAERRFDPVRM